MKRLIYAPKVRAFIRSKSLTTHYKSSAFIVDVSNDVVSGSVTRNDHGKSTANLVLRNRHKKYTRHKESGKPVFMPMDMITIFMQRIAGKPIQVFTGYLDETPYFQLYPGDCQLTATCTLKRLEKTWFDPGLNFFRSFMQENGWTYTPDGTGLNYASAGATGGVEGEDVLIDNQHQKQGGGADIPVGARDGGFGQLLLNFLVQVAGWKPNHVLVSKLPANVSEFVSQMILDTGEDSLARQVASDVDAMNHYMAQMMTVEAIPPDENGNLRTLPQFVTQKLSDVAASHSIPPVALVYAAMALSGYRPTYIQRDMSSTTGGYGLFAFKSETQEGLLGGERPEEGEEQTVAATITIDGRLYSMGPLAGVDSEDISDPTVSGGLAARIATEQAPRAIDRVRDGELDAIHYVAEVIGGRQIDLTAEEQQSMHALAKTYLTGLDNNDEAFFETPPVPEGTLENVQWQSPELQQLLNEAEDAEVKKLSETHDNSVATFTYWTKSNFPFLSVSKPHDRMFVLANREGVDFDPTRTVVFRGTTMHLNAMYESLKGAGDVTGKVVLRLAGSDAIKVLKNGISESFDGDGTYGTVMTGNHSMIVELRGPTKENPNLPDFSALGTTPGFAAGELQEDGSLDEPVGDVSYDQISRIAGTAAFVGKFAFPTDYVESVSLRGERALMNDMNCLDGALQFAQASLRNFMSMPDGRVIAYYPDYFGGYGREPYWWIPDIETTNMGIQLNDHTLATHVYTPGQTLTPFSDDVGMLNRLHSMGVATIRMTDIIERVVNPGLVGENIDSEWSDAFLDHFGARVAKEEAGIIKSHFYEFLMAFNRFSRLWAENFTTRIEFTFQPEVMAGGLVGFADHGIQMYCKSVTHTFDYTGGFTTSAEMMAPAIFAKSDSTVLEDFPGMALAGVFKPFGGGGGGA